jgi:hypothetical protein
MEKFYICRDYGKLYRNKCQCTDRLNSGVGLLERSCERGMNLPDP